MSRALLIASTTPFTAAVMQAWLADWNSLDEICCAPGRQAAAPAGPADRLPQMHATIATRRGAIIRRQYGLDGLCMWDWVLRHRLRCQRAAR